MKRSSQGEKKSSRKIDENRMKIVETAKINSKNDRSMKLYLEKKSIISSKVKIATLKNRFEKVPNDDYSAEKSGQKAAKTAENPKVETIKSVICITEMSEVEKPVLETAKSADKSGIKPAKYTMKVAKPLTFSDGSRKPSPENSRVQNVIPMNRKRRMIDNVMHNSIKNYFRNVENLSTEHNLSNGKRKIQVLDLSENEEKMVGTPTKRKKCFGNKLG